jgi:CHAD domain-containing protein
VSLRPETPAGVAIATVLLHFADKIVENVEGTVKAIDSDLDAYLLNLDDMESRLSLTNPHDHSPSEQVHAFRKRCKELRYLLEVFRPLHEDKPHRSLIKELKGLQDTLGEFQGGEVQRDAVREFAVAMMQEGAAPPETVLAMGESAAQLDAQQLRAGGPAAAAD